MQVPERIIVKGRNHHVGTSAIPIEIKLDNITMQSNREDFRVQTPPRSITLKDEVFDSNNYSSNNYHKNFEHEQEDDTLVIDNNKVHFLSTFQKPNNITPNIRNEAMSGYYEGDEFNSEMEHLREQIGRLNARLVSVEEEVNNTKERETYLMIGALIYVTIHACSWLFKSNR